MMLSTNQLLELIYHYYARGVGTMDPGYPTTEEKLRLVERCKSAGTGEPFDRFRQMILRLDARFPEFSMQNGALHLAAGGYDACYSAKAWLPNPAVEVASYYIGFFISILAPVYVIYRSIRYAPPEEKTWPLEDQLRSILAHPAEETFTFTPEEQRYADEIGDEIEAIFGGEPLPPEIGNIAVPDVDAGQRGLGKETIFTCLCSGYW